jgi:hypothetical protein
VTQYQEGTLVLDFIDAKEKTLAWRAIAQKVLEDAPSPERVQKDLDQIAQKLLEKYPPKQSKRGQRPISICLEWGAVRLLNELVP